MVFCISVFVSVQLRTNEGGTTGQAVSVQINNSSVQYTGGLRDNVGSIEALGA